MSSTYPDARLPTRVFETTFASVRLSALNLYRLSRRETGSVDCECCRLWLRPLFDSLSEFDDDTCLLLLSASILVPLLSNSG